MQVLELTQDFMKRPFRLLVKREHLSLEGIRQYYVAVDKAQLCRLIPKIFQTALTMSSVILGQEEWKFDTLCDIFDSVAITQAVIFCSLLGLDQIV